MTLLKALRGIGLIGLVAGTLDISAAFLNYAIALRRNPIRVLYYVASGVFGSKALTGDASYAAWGLAIHYTIAYGWTTLFFLCYPIISRFSTNRVANGLVYGVFVWLCMNLLIVPRSNVPSMSFKPVQVVIGVVTLMLMIGLPIAYMTDRDYRAANQAAKQ